MKMNGVGDAFVELAMKGQCVWKGWEDQSEKQASLIELSWRKEEKR
jgi:hypothetical protein